MRTKTEQSTYYFHLSPGTLTRGVLYSREYHKARALYLFFVQLVICIACFQVDFSFHTNNMFEFELHIYL